MRIFAIFTCAYLLTGMFISMLMDRFKQLDQKVFFLGVIFWPLVLPITIGAAIREIRRRP
jgi:hypothetical protein